MNGYDSITPSTTSLVYNIIRRSGGINRMGITDRSGVSKSTVSLQIAKLLKLGLIEEVPPADGSRRKLKLKICGGAGQVAGIFLGTRKLSIILFSLDKRILWEEYRDWEDISDPVACNAEIIRVLKEICAARGIDRLWGIGCGFPFPVNFREGKPDSPPNVPLWHDYPLQELYREEFGCPVLIDNDVNVMALGEVDSAAHSGEEDFLFIKAGTGIGAGLIVGGGIYRGAKGCAGDIGHIAVDGSGVRCHCGNMGCLEAAAGGRALAQRAAEAARSGESPYLASLAAAGAELSAEDVGRGAVAGDLGCIGIVRTAGETLGGVASKLVNFFNPSSIVVGGGLAGFGPIYLGAVRGAIVSRSPHLATFELTVRVSEQGERSGPAGAGTLILDHIFSAEEFGRTVGRNLPGGS